MESGRAVRRAKTKTPAMRVARRISKAVQELCPASIHRVIRQIRRRLIVRDQLTGLLNRTAFARRAEQALRRVPKGSQSALLVVNVDGLARANHMLGHARGDQHLQAIAELIQLAIPTALVGRWGGNEFVVLVPPRIDGVALAERIRSEVAARYEELGEAVNAKALAAGIIDVSYPTLTVRIGVCDRKAGSVDELVALASTAIYVAAVSDHNCVRVAQYPQLECRYCSRESPLN